jgi:hypothetical protein
VLKRSRAEIPPTTTRARLARRGPRGRSLSHVKVRRCAVFLLIAAVATLEARADNPCAGFSRDVTRERVLFGTQPLPLSSGRDAASAPALTLDRLYKLSLATQTAVAFAAVPGKKKTVDGAYAGLAGLTVATSATYRIALDQPFWVDVVKGGAQIASSSFQGQPGCSAPHKIVEFVLPAGTSLTIQISGFASPSVVVSVTRAPP